MNKSKVSLSQVKPKNKVPLPATPNNKTLSKAKDKTDRISPRANRMHTLEAKKSIQIPRKGKPSLEMSPLQEKNTNKVQHGKGYETPKFKWEEPSPPKRMTVAHNFFSFGEKEREQERLKQLIHKPEKSPPPRGKQSRQIKPQRKQNLIRF